MARMPFAWSRFEREIGRELPGSTRNRLERAVTRPSRETWVDARSIVAAPQMSITGQTLWQCVEAVCLSRFPDDRTPSGDQIARALCYAAGIPAPSSSRR
jgi:hypothetical protein